MKKQILSIIAGMSLAAGLSAQAFIPNSGFEQWSSTAGEDQDPTGWISYNIFTFSLLDPTNQNPTIVTQATGVDAYQGTYSAKITTGTLVNNPNSASIPNQNGSMFTGAVQFSSPYMLPGYGTQQRPQTFSYASKYSPVSGDTAFTWVVLTHWNGSGRDTIAVGLDYIPVAVAAYAVRNITLTYNAAFSSTFPDTCLILFSASATAMHDGSSFYVDDLSFTGYVGMNEANNSSDVSVYPNPSNGVTFFDVTGNDAMEVVAYDMAGREVKRASIVNKHAELSAYQLAVGTYTYTILNTAGEVMSRGKFSISE